MLKDQYKEISANYFLWMLNRKWLFFLIILNNSTV